MNLREPLTRVPRAVQLRTMLRTRLIAGRTSGLILGALFASIMTLASQVEVVLEPLRVDPARPAPVTLRVPESFVPEESARTHHGIPMPLTARRGEVVEDPQTQRIVRAYERVRRPPKASTLTGIWISYFVIAYIFLAYLRTFTGGRGGLLRTQAGLLVLVGATCLVAKLLLLFTGLSPFIIPLATVPLWGALYFNRATAAASGGRDCSRLRVVSRFLDARGRRLRREHARRGAFLLRP